MGAQATPRGGRQPGASAREGTSCRATQPSQSGRPHLHDALGREVEERARLGLVDPLLELVVGVVLVVVQVAVVPPARASRAA